MSLCWRGLPAPPPPLPVRTVMAVVTVRPVFGAHGKNTPSVSIGLGTKTGSSNSLLGKSRAGGRQGQQLLSRHVKRCTNSSNKCGDNEAHAPPQVWPSTNIATLPGLRALHANQC